MSIQRLNTGRSTAATDTAASARPARAGRTADRSAAVAFPAETAATSAAAATTTTAATPSTSSGATAPGASGATSATRGGQRPARASPPSEFNTSGLSTTRFAAQTRPAAGTTAAAGAGAVSTASTASGSSAASGTAAQASTAATASGSTAATTATADPSAATEARRRAELLDGMDSDRSGTVSADELSAFSERMLQTIQEGLSSGALQAPAPASPSNDLFARIDRDGDQRLSRSEFGGLRDRLQQEIGAALDRLGVGASTTAAHPSTDGSAGLSTGVQSVNLTA
ncbi:EF hand domain-containing protein [Sphaerotilus hippei]|uniref:EF hand domain-containing protein n=1 Tax=Sphaerotilus hippei TaxID=744406 RepID=A0A318H7F6_9BURK|nr:EF-hand domain-containing protein [Sphaerotilus hippei]PXW98594.1 EF hand domain-containing protein [Sphaerotilus hippei]